VVREQVEDDKGSRVREGIRIQQGEEVDVRRMLEGRHGCARNRRRRPQDVLEQVQERYREAERRALPGMASVQGHHRHGAEGRCGVP